MLLFIIFNDLSQTSYLKIYRTDLRQFFRVGRTVAVDDQSKNSFFDPSWMFPRQPILLVLSTLTQNIYLCGFIHRTDSVDAGG